MNKFKVGDEIIVNSGGQKGKKGKIEIIYGNKDKAKVSGVNIYKRHRKAARNRSAGVFEIARPMHLSKLSIICPKCKKTTRLGFITEGDKKRICKKCKGVI